MPDAWLLQNEMALFLVEEETVKAAAGGCMSREVSEMTIFPLLDALLLSQGHEARNKTCISHIRIHREPGGDRRGNAPGRILHDKCMEGMDKINVYELL